MCYFLGGSYSFNTSASNQTQLILNNSKSPTPLVFTFTTDVDKQILIDFDEKTPLPGTFGQNLIELYENNGRSGEPFIKLSSGQYPPDIMASNTNQLKVVFNQIVDLKNTFVRTVTKGCHSTYAGISGASFILNGNCSGLNSWLIPKKDNSNGTFVLQFSLLNLTKNTDEVMIEMLGTITSSVLKLKGELLFSTIISIFY